MQPVEVFLIVYFTVSLYYLGYRYFFALWNNHFAKKDKSFFCPTVSVIIPTYNEDPKYLVPCIESNCLAEYANKEVIVVDDGSKQETAQTLETLKAEYGVKLITFQKNKGKREALFAGITAANGEIVVTMDSDTVLPDGQSLFNLVQPLKDRNVGAVSGVILVKNSAKNLLTRVMDARYWLAFFIEKASQNPYDGVTCCSGPFSAYRKEYLQEYLDEWKNQVFLGNKCTYGDDRGLTTMMQRKHDVKFTGNAIAYTFVPETLKKFCKQQIRWKKSFIRESFYLLKILPKKSFLMVFEFYLFWAVFLMGYIAKLLSIYLIFLNPIAFAPYIVMIFLVSVMHYSYAFFRKPVKFLFGLLYGFLYEFLVTWLFFIALFNLRDTRWGTR